MRVYRTIGPLVIHVRSAIVKNISKACVTSFARLNFNTENCLFSQNTAAVAYIIDLSYIRFISLSYEYKIF